MFGDYLRWTEMSYYKVEKEENETINQRLRNEGCGRKNIYECIDRNYSTFFEDNYDECSGGKYWNNMD